MITKESIKEFMRDNPNRVFQCWTDYDDENDLLYVPIDLMTDFMENFAETLEEPVDMEIGAFFQMAANGLAGLIAKNRMENDT